MKKIFFFILLCCYCFNISAQISITPSAPTIPCGSSVTLTASPTCSDVLITMPDDVYSNVIPIGFNFNFYGNVYSNCQISSNGYITFDSYVPGSYSAWPISTGIFSNPEMRNSIAGVFTDIFIPAGGNISYGVRGTAPNRKFIVSFCNCALFSCTSQKITFQIILNEGSNTAEVHIANRNVCASWNGGAGIEGVENDPMTAGTAAPGRNYPPGTWTATTDAYRFTPNGSYTAYSVASIGYAPYPTCTMSWYQGATLIGTGPSITVSPTSTTTYEARSTSCDGTVSNAYATVTVTQLPPNGGNIEGVDHLCAGDCYTYTNPTSPGGTWSCSSSPAGIATINSSTGELCTTGAGTVTIYYTTAATPCTPSVTISKTITVSPLPTAYVVETTGHHCEGDVLTFCVHGPPYATIAYDGNPCDGVAWPYPGMSYIAHLDGTGTFCFSVTAVAPSTSFHLVFVTDPVTGCTNFIDQTVDICVAPHPVVGTIFGPDVLCETETGHYTATFTGAPGGMWGLSNTNGMLVVPTSATTDVLALTAGTVTLTFTAINCCGSDFVTKTITIKPMPHAIMTYTGCNPPCPGTPITCIITGTPGATVTYGWIEPGGGSGTATVTLDAMGNAYVTLPTATATGMYHLLINSVTLDGCTDPYGIEMKPLIIDWPRACFDQSPVPPCEGGCVHLHVSGTPGATGFIEPGHIPFTLDAMGQWGSPCITVFGPTTFTISTVYGPCCSHTQTCSLTVTPIPYPVMTLTSNSPVCEGDAIILTGTCSPSSPFYDWTFPGLPGVSTLTPNYTIAHSTLADGGIYYLTGYNGPCATTVTTNVIVKPIPPMPTAVYTGCRPPCPGTPITYTIHGLPGATVTYGWTDPVTGMHSATVVLDALGNGYVSVTSSGTGMFIFSLMSIMYDGCVNNAGIDLIPLTIDWPKACFDQSPRPPCDGGCIYLHVSGTPGASGFIEPGHIHFTLDAMGQWGSPCITIHGPTTYTISMVTGACCSHEQECAITVIPIPVPVITLAPSTVCEGTPLVLTATCTPSSPFYDWLIPGVPGFSTTTNTYTVTGWATSANDGVYTVTGWNNGCSATATTTIHVIPLPVAHMWCEVLCAQGNGATVVLHFTGTPGSTVYYSPMPPSGPPFTVVLDAFGNATVTTTIYSITTWAILDVVSPEGCHSMVSFPGCTTDPATVTPPTVDCWVYQDHTPPYAWHFGYVSSAPVSIFGSADIYDPVSGISCTGVLPVPNPFPIPAGSTEMHACDFDLSSCPGISCATAYIVRLTASGFMVGDCRYPMDCVATMSRPGGNTTKAGGVTYSDLTVVPNPNTGIFTLKGSLADDATQDVHLEIVDMLGKVVHSETFTVENGSIDKKINVGSLASGVYLIKLRNDGVNEAVKFTLTR